MATSPSQKWEDGRLVERAIETNRWRILPDGTEVSETEEVEAKATRDYKAPVPTKQMSTEDVENKAVKRTARKATKK
jgi:hypothetical protein